MRRRCRKFLSAVMAFVLVLCMGISTCAQELQLNMYGSQSYNDEEEITYELEEKIVANTSNTSNKYSTNWEFWSAGASKYPCVRSSGCRVIACAKAAKEAGLNIVNPDDFYDWCKSNNCYDGNISEYNGLGGQLIKYVNAHQGSILRSETYRIPSNKAEYQKVFMDYMKQGKQIIVTTENGNGHSAYIGRDASLKAGVPVILDSYMGSSYNSSTKHTFTSTDTITGVEFTKYRVYTINKAKQDQNSNSITVSHKGSSNVTGTSFDITAEVSNPYGYNVSQIGLYIGTDPNNLSRKVNDFSLGTGTTFTYSCTQRKPGSTWYYRMFVVSNGFEYVTPETIWVTTIDTESPVISDVQISNVDNTGYTISCIVTDNGKVDRVQFPTWTEANGQDDILTEWWSNTAAKGTFDGTRWSYRVNDTAHNCEKGLYNTHIYAYDSVDNNSCWTLQQSIENSYRLISVC